MELKLSASWTKLTTKPDPEGHPALGGLAVIESNLPSINAASTWSPLGMTEGF